MRVRFKIQKATDFKPTLRHAERWWINLPDGRYFWVARSAAGSWFESHSEWSMDYPSVEAAITEGLTREIRIDPSESYRRLRNKEQVYNIHTKPKGRT